MKHPLELRPPAPLTITSRHDESCAGVHAKAGESPSRHEGSLVRSALPLSVTHRNLLCLLLLVAMGAWLWPSLVELVSLTQQQEHYSHMVLIPWLSLYVLYLDRTSILASREWSPWLGLLVLSVGAFVWWAGGATNGSDRLSFTILAFVVMCWGLFLFGFGISCTRRVSFGLWFLIFLVPIPSGLLSSIIGFLQWSSAEASALLFSFLGVPVFRQGFVFSLSTFTIHVAEECSGIRSALSLVLTSLVAGHFFLRSLWGKAGIVAIVIPLAIIKNAFRIVGLALLANYVDPTYITNSALHRSGGIPLFLVSLVLLFSLVWLVRRLEKKFGYESASDVPGMEKPAALNPRKQQA